MKIEEKINESIKDSMKKKDSLRLDSLRAIKSAILIEKTKSGSKDNIEESVIIKILQKMVKQRNDSAKIYFFTYIKYILLNIKSYILYQNKGYQ